MVLHHHLLLQQEAHEHGADKVAVQPGTALQIAPRLLQQLPQLFPAPVSHADIDLLQVLPQVHRLAVDLQFLFCLCAAAGQLLRFGGMSAPQGLPPLHADEEAVKSPLKSRLLLPALGVHRLQGRSHRLPVPQVQAGENLAGVRRLLQAHRQPLPAQQGGKFRQLLQIDGHACPAVPAQRPQCSWAWPWE